MKYRVSIGGIMGVPITYLDKHIPDTGGGTNWLDLLIQHDGSENMNVLQSLTERNSTTECLLENVEIVKFRKGNDNKDLSVDGKCPYFRILIRRKV